MRPLNGAIAGAAVLVGAFVSRTPTHWGTALLGAGAAFAAAAGANALNDIVDAEADSVNRPTRPIPSGRVSRRAAVVAAAWGYAISMGLAATVGPRAFALAVVWTILTALYSWTLKGVPLVGNIVVSIAASTPFLMGGFTQGKYLLALIPTALAFLLHLAREVVKDVEDMEGDAAQSIRTLAVRRGAGVSFAVVRIVLVLLIGAAALPFAFRIYGWGYAALIVAIDVLLLRLIASLGGGAGVLEARRASITLKIVMVMGLVAFAVGVL